MRRALAIVSFGMPTGAVVRSGEAGSLAVLADVLLRSGDLPRAEETARRATRLDAGCVVAWYNLGVIEERARTRRRGREPRTAARSGAIRRTRVDRQPRAPLLPRAGARTRR
jgi:hypothetical protein